jgi:hypothetical protein
VHAYSYKLEKIQPPVIARVAWPQVLCLGPAGQ